MPDLTIVYRKTADLIFSEYNPRQMTEAQHKALKDSIVRLGVIDPLIVNMHPDRQNVIVGGHMRARIAAELGMETVPCVEVQFDRDKEREANIRLNRNLGEWDFDLLADNFELEELVDWGFEKDELIEAFDLEEIPADNKDIDEAKLTEITNECPKCGFKW